MSKRDEKNERAEQRARFGSTAKRRSPDDFDASGNPVTGLPDREPAGEQPEFDSTARKQSPDDE